MLSPAESNLLALLGKEWDITGPPGIMDISDFVVALPLSPSETLGTIKDFYSIGLIDMNTIKTAVFLTPEGYETVERERGLEQEDT